MIASRGMVAVFGVTYRLVERDGLNHVVRVLDDRMVGAFRHEPALAIVDRGVESETLLAVAKEALRSAKLRWAPSGSRGGYRRWIRRLLRESGDTVGAVGTLVASAFRWPGGLPARPLAAARNWLIGGSGALVAVPVRRARG